MLATGLFVAALAAAPILAPDDDREAALAVGRVLLERQDFDGALLHLEPLAAAAPDDLEIQLMLGLAYFGGGRFDRARAPFEAVVAAEPGDALPWEFLGRIEFQLGRLGRAVTCLEQAAAIDPRDGRTHNHLGAVLVRMKRTEDARAAFLAALSFDPSYAVAHYNLGAIAALDGDDLAGTYHLREAARLDETDDDPTQALGDLHARLGDDEAALTWHRESALRAPGVYEHQISIGEACERLGRSFDAELALVRACELAPDDVTPFLHLAQFFARAARVHDAMRAYREALGRDADSVFADKGMADVAEDAGRDALARRHIERILARGFTHPELLRRLCFVCERLGDDAGARDAFRQLVLESDGDDASLRAIAECMSLSAVDDVRDVERGRELAAALVEKSAERSAAALYVLSRAEAELGDAAAAARNLERAAELFHAQQPEAVLLRRLSEQARAGR